MIALRGETYGSALLHMSRRPSMPCSPPRLSLGMRLLDASHDGIPDIVLDGGSPDHGTCDEELVLDVDKVV